MASPDDDFDELRERIKVGRGVGSASFEPIYYLVFDPSKILDVKRRTPAWVSRLGLDGYKVQVFSIANAILEIFENDPRRQIWLAADHKAPLDFKRTNASLANALTSTNALQKRLDATLSSLDGNPQSIVMVTDIEALHPYLRIGAIEAQLQGRFSVPTIFLYPGVRAGSTKLKFLGFYPEDGNYRSVHVGG